MKKEIKNFLRSDLFWQYHNRDNPFVIVTTRIDITNIYQKCKNYYPSIAYFLLLAANKVENFKYRYIDGKFYQYDLVKPAFTELGRDKKIGFFGCDLSCYSNFIETYKKLKEEFMTTGKSVINPDEDEIWLSCTPWFSFTSLIPPFDKNITIPQFIWDQFDIQDGKCFIHLMIMAHHGFVDGYHISLFLTYLNDIISNIDQYLR